MANHFQVLLISYSILIQLTFILIHFLFILVVSFPKFFKQEVINKGVVNKVWGLDGLLISHSFLWIPIHFPFISKKVMRKWKEVNEEEKKANAANDPIQNLQYICQYKIQYIIPNTFSNKESIAQEDSLHNQLKNFISYPLIVWGGGGGGGGRGFINHYPTLVHT